MKIATVGKGGSGKTTIAGVLSDPDRNESPPRYRTFLVWLPAAGDSPLFHRLRFRARASWQRGARPLILALMLAAEGAFAWLRLLASHLELHRIVARHATILAVIAIAWQSL